MVTYNIKIQTFKTYNMKKIFLSALVLIQFNVYAQTNSAEDLYKQGYKLLNGFGKRYNPDSALNLFKQSAALGNGQAANTIGNMYIKGLGIIANMDSAIQWYKQAAANSYAPACNNVAQLYKEGVGVSQDFAIAVHYYKKGVALNDINSKNLLAYMNYKGLGTPQNYTTAFNLYKEVADSGNKNAAYFLGLCYRNGYGTSVNKELAKQWLLKASQSVSAQATQELEEPMPENMSTVSNKLQNQWLTLRNYQEKYTAISSNNYEGNYTGYAIYYDWSGKYVSEIKPLKINLQQKNNGYSGTWQEGESTAPINLSVQGNIFTFDTSNNYTRINHYSGRTAEPWQFNQAQLQVGFLNDSVQLSGYVQFYSPTRKEPGKPLQIIVKKSVGTRSTLAKNIKVELFPNPTNKQSNIQFTLPQTAKVAINITSQNGKLIYKEAEKLLPAGTYNYPITVANYAAGTYNVTLFVNGRIAVTNTLIKQ